MRHKRPKQEWEIGQDPAPDFTYYASLFENGVMVWRSLSAIYSTTADRWLRQAKCHGTRKHARSCANCRAT